MALLTIGIAILFIGFLTDLDDVFFGIPVLPSAGVGMFTYGALTFTTYTQPTMILVSIIAALIIFFVYQSAKKTNTRNMNKGQ
ncbi:hypothetical protein KIT04_049 [Vibrio phage KIT04]|nr:hypothetical protein KIT04_049 [Vibrio phage KIT04]